MRVDLVGAAVLCGVAVTGCGGEPARANLKYRPKDAFGEIAAKAAESPCKATTGAPPVPSMSRRARGSNDYGPDVLFYFAHPEDETLFTPGTIDALARAKKNVVAAYLSHGEGGRLLERSPDGQLREKTDVTASDVAKVRDREVARVIKTLGVQHHHLYPATTNADFSARDVSGLARAIHSCSETYERWHELLPDGLGGLVKVLVDDIRARRPRIIVTHDARDDDDFLDHGHHKAFGALVDLAARAAADPRFPGAPLHVVEELDTIAPKQVQSDLTLPLGNEMRKRLMAEHASQFDLQKLEEVGSRTVERYVVQWRAQGAPPAPAGSLLATLVQKR